ncbi:membrane protein insertion efficiency factor YidD [Metallumcola ferriviriculae]|uniref:Putative membrane protein insertion efficiency factor n=1 Tax=Metallumcola ferriviriculae TaxID=3039180 RepID=A0AAU0UJ65_9FIRM|nr:membrane protein insertion efficiency factor YidD [Desulfitibacteraceae bacterium MK1]
MTRVFIYIIKMYQKYISAIIGRHCRFYPTCSQYSVEALEHYGFVKGLILSGKRIIRCHPWNDGGYDPVIKNEKGR